MPEPTPEAWAQIRHDYEHTDKPLAHICAEHEITIPMMRYRMKRWEWTRRKPLIPRHGPPPVLPSVIPGRGPQAASPESITPAAAYGFRARVFDASRNDEGEAPTPPENPPHPISSPCSEIDLSPHAGRGNEPIVPRLQAAAARVLPAIEVAIARLASGELNSRDLEKTGRTLATLTRTLRELNALLVQQDAPLQPEDEPLDIDEFRNELARRIRAFIATEQSDQGAQPGQAARPEGPAECPPAAAMDGPAQA